MSDIIIIHRGNKFYKIPIDYIVYIAPHNRYCYTNNSILYGKDGKQYILSLDIQELHEIILEQLGQHNSFVNFKNDILINITYIFHVDTSLGKLILSNFNGTNYELFIPNKLLEQLIPKLKNLKPHE